MKKRLLTGIIMSVATISLVPGAAFAHVIVTPGQAGIGEELTFNISVPNEEQVAVTNVKLDIPDGVTDVTPTTKEGWTITTTSNGSTSDPEVTDITWSDGTIPVGQRQDFSFSAQVPAKATDLGWKAYQTYADGTIVRWDRTPAGSDDATDNVGPYSVTHVVNDLTATSSTIQAPNNTLPIVLSIAAVVLSIGSLLIRKRR